MSRDEAPDAGARQGDTVFRMIPLDRIIPSARNPRTAINLDTAKMQELRASIQEGGLINPLLVRPIGADSYELVCGHRRYYVAQDLGLSTVPCTIRQLDDFQTAKLSLWENLHRDDLAPVEITLALEYLVNSHVDGKKLSYADISLIVKRDQSWISQYLVIADDELARDAVVSGDLNPKQGLEVARAEDPALKRRLLDAGRAGTSATTLRAMRFELEPPDGRDRPELLVNAPALSALGPTKSGPSNRLIHDMRVAVSELTARRAELTDDERAELRFLGEAILALAQRS